MRLSSFAVAFAALAGSSLGARIPGESIETRQSSDKYVFAHFVLGIVASYQQSDWENGEQAFP
jgi:glucan endo-1,3-alpha-glucosidase